MKPNTREALAAYSEKFGFLLGSGVPLVQALEIILAETRDGFLVDSLRQVIGKIGEGGRFCDALADHPQLFSASYLGMVRSAESQGILDVMMGKLARGLRDGLIPVGGLGEASEDPTATAGALPTDPTRPDAAAEVDALLHEAVARKASDLHLTPIHEGLLAEFRIDGVLVEAKRFTPDLGEPVITRIKFMAGLDLGEKYLPQDGRHRCTISGKLLDVRVNLLPVALGEKITMRFISHADLRWKPEDIFSDSADQKDFLTMINANFGLIVMAGPTGSGKTTTAYSALQVLRDKNAGAITTLEFPIGVVIDGIAQIPIRPHLGLGYQEALNAIMRGDPDVIFVSDVQDEAVLSRVLKCALTGHLVIVNLHTASVADVFQRLLDLKGPPHLLASAITGVTAQRLVRKVCPTCGKPVKLAGRELKALGWTGTKVHAREGKGCSHCNNSGFRGRIAIYEMLIPDKAFKDSLQSGDMAAIRKALQAGVSRSMAQAAADLVAAGTTTLSEVQRVLRDYETV